MKCVTSFGPEGFELYGRRFLETYVEHVGLPIDVYIEDVKPDFKHPLVTYRELLSVPGCMDFLRLSQFPAAQGHPWGENKYNYRYDAFRFCRKMFAICDATERQRGYLYWIDADVEFQGKFEMPEDFGFMCYLGRPEWHSCTSFLGFDTRHPQSQVFFKRLRAIYTTGSVFILPEWADPQVIDWMREQSGLPAKNLAEGLDLKGPANVFDYVFATAKHKKGNLKFFKNRYEELLSIVETEKPKRILEIGVWNGKRAIELCQYGAEYAGFDLFEEATAETDHVEKNVKAHNSVEAVAERLKEAGVKATLVKGNTRDTLYKFFLDNPEVKFDLAFIDGGHSVKTIHSDWIAVQSMMNPGGLVVFDDYYEDGIDTEQWGANKTVADLPHKLSHSRDPVAGGGVTRLALVRV